MSDVISTAQPRYAQIKEAIRRRISSGDWPEGFQIPSEHKLLEEFSVSRMTVHRALRDLTDEGLLTRVQGLGTFVAERPPSTDVVELRSIAYDHASAARRADEHARPDWAHALRTGFVAG